MCPPNLRVAFNKIMSEVQGPEALLTDLKLTHYQERVLQRGKKGKTIRHGNLPQNRMRFLKNRPIVIKPHAGFLTFDRFNDPPILHCNWTQPLKTQNIYPAERRISYSLCNNFLKDWKELRETFILAAFVGSMHECQILIAENVFYHSAKYRAHI